MKNLEFNNCGNFVSLPKKGKEKERVRSFLRALAWEIFYFSPVRGRHDKILKYEDKEIKEEVVKRSHYRRLNRAYKRNGMEGILKYLETLASEFSDPITKDSKKLSTEEFEKNVKSVEYFNSLLTLVQHLKLPKRQ